MPAMRDLPTLVIVREFDAPRELVWRAWTDRDLLPRWYGPRVETIVHRLDLVEDGLWLVEMRWAGNSSYQRAEYTEIVRPARLVWLHSVADRDWDVIPEPRMAGWPRVLLTTVTFEDVGERTRMRLTWEPHEAGEAEVSCFWAAKDGVGKGWEAGLDLLAELLAQLQE